MLCSKCGIDNLRHSDDSLILLTLSHKLQSDRCIFEGLGRVIFPKSTVSKVNKSRKRIAPYTAHIPSGPPYSGIDVQVLVDQVQDLLW
jgi:hypothetical protein